MNKINNFNNVGRENSQYLTALREEISSHLAYREALEGAINYNGDFLEKLTAEIIERHEVKKEKLNREDFVEMEKKAVLTNLYNLEMLKVDTRLELLYRLGAPLGVLPGDDTAQGETLRSVALNLASSFSFASEKGAVVPKDEESFKKVMDSTGERVMENSLEARYRELKAQYESFQEYLKTIRKNGENGQKTHS